MSRRDAYDLDDVMSPAEEAAWQREWDHQEEPQICETCGTAFGPLGVARPDRWCGPVCQRAARWTPAPPAEPEEVRQDRLIAESGRTVTGEVIRYPVTPGSAPIVEGTVIPVGDGAGIVMADLGDWAYEVWLVED